MGVLDAEAKQYLGMRKTFADAFNYLLYDGEPVIDPDSPSDYKLNIISAADIADDDFEKFHTILGKILRIVKHQKNDADKLIEELGRTKIEPEAAFFLKKAANLDIEIEVKDGGRKSSSGRLFCADRSGA